jgi:hypothetical protein
MTLNDSFRRNPALPFSSLTVPSLSLFDAPDDFPDSSEPMPDASFRRLFESRNLKTPRGEGR